MTDYQRLTVRCRYGRHKSFVNNIIDTLPVVIEDTPSFVHHGIASVDSSTSHQIIPNTLMYSGYTACTLVLHNEDADEWATITYTDGNATAHTMDVPPGGLFVEQNVDPTVAVKLGIRSGDTGPIEVRFYLGVTIA